MPLVKKTYARKKTDSVENVAGKENIDTKRKYVRESKSKALKKIEENIQDDSFNFTLKHEKSPDPFDLLCSSPLKQDVNFKPLSFWGQKVKDLEGKKHAKNKKCQLYELSDAEDSISSTEGKKMRKKARTATGRQRNKKKQVNIMTYQLNLKNLTKKNELNLKQERERKCDLFKEELILRRLNQNQKENKFSFNQISTFGLTSTPGKEKVNVIGCSAFDFLSPIPNEGGQKLNESVVTDYQKDDFITPRKLRKRNDSDKGNSFFHDLTDEDLNREIHDTFEEAFIVDSSNNTSIYDSDMTLNLYRLANLLKWLCDSPDKFSTKIIDLNSQLLPQRSRLSLPCPLPIKDHPSVTKQTNLDLDFSKTCKDSEIIHRDSFSNVTKRRPCNNFLNFRMSATDQSFKLELERIDNICTDFLQCNVSSRVSNNITCGEDGTLEHNETDCQQTHGNNNLDNGSNQYRSKENDIRNDEVCFNVGNDSSIFLSSCSSQFPDTVVACMNCTTCGNAVTEASPVAKRSEPSANTMLADEIPKKSALPEVGDITFNELDFPLPMFESTTCSTSAGRGTTLTKLDIIRSNIESTRIPLRETHEETSKMIMDESKLTNFSSINLKPGKKWRRSASIMRKVLSGTFSEKNVSKKRGKNYLPFVEEVLNMQDEGNNYHSLSNESSVISITNGMANLTVSFRNIGNRTIRVIDQTACEGLEHSFLSMLSRVVNADTSATVITDVNGDGVKIYSARDLILMRCGQEEPLPFEECFNERTLKNCRKIGEGAFGEVFMCNSKRVFKVIPVEGDYHVNGEPQKKFEEVFTEVVVAMELSNLRTMEEHNTSGFCESKRCWCVVGKYPQHLIDLWNDFDSNRGSENDSPVIFKSDQLYIVMEFANGGQDLEAFVFASAEQSLSIFYQLVYTLAVAEKVLEFEHRDLHWGNILIAPTRDKYFKVSLNNSEYKIPTRGVKLSIIDYTLSRITYDGCCIYYDLSADPTLFTSHGDYQFDIYRMMKKEVANDWSLFRPKTNLFWLHYVADKMITMTRYKKTNTKIHNTSIQRLNELKSCILKYENSEQLLLEELI